MMNDIALQLSSRERGAREIYNSIDVRKTKNIRLRAHLFNDMVLSVLMHALESWTLCKLDENGVSALSNDESYETYGSQNMEITDAVTYIKSCEIR
ncbi:hypothetical protein Y032_0066g3701 [Ancylostoma ceylanicum]|uniref:Uncharacterized protein n=1 Tax=Ancylostoma ceylanicum TaxID=53326 RepID=A0A016TZW2_9BILA|nr:hypothetical protein Y032_0066g3701 [Ancylostoma ceylanicum]